VAVEGHRWIGWDTGRRMQRLKLIVQQVPELRRNHAVFRKGPVLTIVAMALLSGAQQISEMARFGHRRNQKQRAHLRLPRSPKGPRFWRVPGCSVYCEVLKRLDGEAFSRLLSQWLQTQQGRLPRALALIRGSSLFCVGKGGLCPPRPPGIYRFSSSPQGVKDAARC